MGSRQLGSESRTFPRSGDEVIGRRAAGRLEERAWLQVVGLCAAVGGVRWAALAACWRLRWRLAAGLLSGGLLWLWAAGRLAGGPV